MSNLKIKALVIVAVILACIYGIIGLPKSKDELVQNWKNNIRLGLDLKGGSQLVLQIQLQDAFKAEADAVMDHLKDEMKKASVEYTDMNRNDPQTLKDADKIQVNISGVPATKAGNFRQIVQDSYSNSWNLATVSPTDYRMTIQTSAALKLRQDALTQSINTIEKKINGLGVAESSVQPQGRSDGESDILVQLPGVDDPGSHQADFEDGGDAPELYEVQGGPFGSREEAMSSKGGVLPLGSQILPGANKGGPATEVYILTRSPVVTGRDLRDAQPQQADLGRWQTSFVLSQDAARKFERFTSANIGNRLAIVLDKRVLSAPTIQAKISDSGVITGAANHDEAADLALNLRAGSLRWRVWEVSWKSETGTGPSLGSDSIRDGIVAGVAGVIAVVIVMLVYYKKAGINMTLALVLNAVILIAALSYLEAGC